jgi:Putative peptidoglycan-binding domain-containing protein
MTKKSVRLVAALAAAFMLLSLLPGNLVFADSPVTNEVMVYDYLVGTMGLNTAAACGVLANAKGESAFNPTRIGDEGTSYGLFQWRADRREELETYCRNNGYDYTTLIGQLHYMEYDLKRHYKYILNHLNAVENTSDGAYDAGYYWCYYYEVPTNREADSAKRGAMARDTYWDKYLPFGGKTINSSDEIDFDHYDVEYSRLLRVTESTMTGLDVLYVQVSLNKLGYPIDADGYYGNDTAAVVTQFQADHGLDADGMCGRMTWDAIKAAMEEYNALNNRLAIVSHPQDITLSTGATAIFAVKAKGNNLTYQWYYRKAGASGWSKWNGHTEAVTSGTVNDTWDGMRVCCDVKDDSGEIIRSAPATITINNSIRIITQPQSVTANVGDSVTFSVEAEGSELRYQWYYRKSGTLSWSEWRNHTSAEVTAEAAASWNGMEVYCVIRDSSDHSINSGIASVAIKDAVSIVGQPADVSIYAGQKAVFSVKAKGTGLTYQWYYKKADTVYWNKWNGRTTASTTATANDTWDGMSVKCEITDANGNYIVSRAAVITLRQPVVITGQPQSVTGQLGDSMTFSVDAEGYGLTYQWYIKKAGASDWKLWSGHTQASTSGTANDSWNGMQIRCIVTDSGNNTAESEAAVITLEMPLAITQQPQSVTGQSGDSMTFRVKATGLGLTYQWYIKKAGASDWKLWSGHTTASTSGTANDSWNGMQIKCVVRDSAGNTAESEAAVITLEMPLAITQQPQSVTGQSGDSMTFRVKATGLGLTYQWYIKKAGASDWKLWSGHTTASTSGTANDSWHGMQIKCVVRDSAGNTAESEAAVITLDTALAITRQPQSVTGQSGDSMTFRVKATGLGLTYQWYIKKAGASDWKLWSGHTTASTSGTANDSWHGMQIKCVVRDSAGNTAESEAAVITLDTALAITQQPQSVTGQSGDSMTFKVKATGLGLTYQWYIKKAGASDWKLWGGHTTASTSGTANDSWHGMQIKCVVRDSAGNTAESEAAVITLVTPEEQ